jgi:hypothetical protein
MRYPAVLALVFLGAAGGGHPQADVRGGVVYVNDVARWPETPLRYSITSPLVWSRRGDALAFAARAARGEARLVVLLVEPGGATQSLEWPIPATAQQARAVTWLGPTRVGTGPSALEPRATATWVVR